MGDRIADLLGFDALAEAERVTGMSYKEDEATSALGFALHMRHSAEKEDALRSSCDSYFAMDLAGTLALYADLGFREVLCDEFSGRDGVTESYRILWHDGDGLLATVESYRGADRNATKVYYNVRLPLHGWGRVTSSGHFTPDGVWVGNHDGREGIRHNLDQLREAGEFITPWVERPFLWLLTYADTDGDYDHEAINAERISRLPADVQRAITPEAVR